LEQQEAAVQFDVDSYEADRVRVVVLRGELDVSTREALAGHTAGAPGSLIVFDLMHLTFVDSSGLGAIHSARQEAIRHGGTLVVSRPSPMVHRVFEITGLDTWIADWNPDWSRRADPGPAATVGP
jgi:anti-anti-sigma factor